MPTYEYRCQKCRKQFSLVLSMTEHDRLRVSCPDCQSDQVSQQYSVFYTQTSKKS